MITWALCGLASLAGHSLLDDSDARLVIGIAVVTAAGRSWCRPMRALAAVAAVLSGCALIGSGARAAWVGTAVGAALAFGLRRPSLPPGRLRAVVAGAVAGALIVGVALLSGVAGASLRPSTGASRVDLTGSTSGGWRSGSSPTIP